MFKQHANSEKVFLIIGTLITWFAIVFQFYLMMLNRQTLIPETIIRFFSFFTILTNILVALCFTFLWIKPKSRWGSFFSQPEKLTAIAVYICIVGITYNTILRFTWNPQGLQRVVDELLHLVVPLFFILYWFIFAPKAGLQWKNVFHWLIYPLVYLLYTLFRGAFAKYYPYPFLDVETLGYYQVFLNSIGLFAVFLLVSLVFVAIAKKKSRTAH
jgi:hypothetical protein